MVKGSFFQGRVFKKDIPYYPEDISEYRGLGEYLEKNDPFQNPQQIRQRTEALGVDPLKTGPFYDVRIKKRNPVPQAANLPEFDYGAVLKKKNEAEFFLNDGHLKEAYAKINESLSLFSEDSRALTIKGKILLAMADVISTLKPKIAHKQQFELLKRQAYLSFVDALKINCMNSEAANFHDAILNEAILKNPSMAEEIKPYVLQPNHVDPGVEEFNAKFKSKNIQPVKKETAKPSDTVTVKAEPLNI
ncbi:hypothetical protein JTE90_012323 [Oedothorax gibbosus]|uniref:Uncharacterized protein n=1 Tax=Oedothorax gibbosus TaxID=931172 RepID=A0AAV6VKT6_9ARAC|nr:hypothetical protein JTE90_012323 [Oedothorax gibbosus]